MVCSACYRKVDSLRSFCPNCGSAVFIDDTEFRERAKREIVRAAEPMQRRVESPSEPRRVQYPQMPRPKPTPSMPPRASLSIGCGGCLVRLVILAALVWYGGRWLLGIPEVRTAFDALLAGSVSDTQVGAAVDAVRSQVLQLLGISR